MVLSIFREGEKAFNKIMISSEKTKLFNVFLFAFSSSLLFSILLNLEKINFYRRFQPIILPLLIFSLLFFLLSFSLYRFKFFKTLILNFSSPFSLFFLIVPMLFSYITREDFKGRLLNLSVLFFILEASIIIKNLRVIVLKIKNFLLNLNNKSLFIFSLLILSPLILFFTIENPYFSGDEPHYYVIASSILKDKDFELKNNYLSMDYKDVNPTQIAPHCHEGRDGGWFSFHLPGISILISPLLPLSKIFFPPWNVFVLRVFLALSGILLSFQIMRFLRVNGFGKNIYLPLYFLSHLVQPFVFHSFHLYPEIFVAFTGLFIINEIFEDKIHGFRGFSDGIIFGFILFWNQKYYSIFVTILILYFISFFKKRRIDSLLLFLIPIISIFLLLIFYAWSTFQVISPLSMRKEVPTLSGISEFIKGFELQYFVESLLDYFFDQRDGLLPNAPFLFFSFFGLIEMAKKNKILFLKMLSVASIYVILYAWNLGRGGYSPFARPLMAISWLFPISLAYFLSENRRNFLRTLFYLSLSITIFFEILFIRYPQFLYQPTTRDISERAGAIFLYLSNLYINIPSLLPSFLKIPNLGYIPNYIWILIFIILLIFYKKLKGLKESVKLIYLGFSLFFIFTIVIFPGLRYFRVQAISIGDIKANFFSLSRNIHISNNEFFVLRDDRYYIPFLTEEKLKALFFYFHSQDFFEINLEIFDIPFFKGIYRDGVFVLENLPSINYKGKKLYLLVLKIKNTRRLNPSYSALYWKIQGNLYK
ncbi:MAG: hypothetical protein ACUVUG_04515 [Candidatus Aminicenantia bacterium]